MLVNDLQLSVTLGAKAKALMQLAEIFASDHPELNADRFFVMFRNTANNKDFSSYEINIADVKGKVHSVETIVVSNEYG